MVMRMVYLDMFFLFLGQDQKSNDPTEYFYLTKNLQIKSEFKIHHQTYYVDKFINYQKGMKLLISMGMDNNDMAVDDKVLAIKIWDFQSLVHSSYMYHLILFSLIIIC